MWWPESLQSNEKYPEAKEKIANVKKNLLEYFDTDYIKWVFKESKKEFGTVEEESKLTTTTLMAGKETLDNTKEYLKKIDDIIVIMPRSEWDKSDWVSGIKSAGVFDLVTNKIYVPDDINEISLAHEVMHALQHNFHRVNNLLTINESKITSVSNLLRDKFLEENTVYKKSDLKSWEESISGYKIALEKKQKDLKVLKIIYEANLQDPDYISASKATQESIVSLRDKIADEEIRKKHMEKTNIRYNALLEENLKVYLVSDTEFHAYLFQLKYACSIYLKNPVKLWSPITIDDINELKENTQYLENTKGTSDVIHYLKFIDKEILAEADADARLDLTKERDKILEELLELANNDLVMNDSTPGEQPIQKA